MIRLIDIPLLDELGAEARGSPRRRRNRNFHRSDEAPANRLLNAVEPGSYVAPHRHLDPDKDETMIVLRGRLALVVFDEVGTVRETAVLGPGLAAFGVDLPHGTWHTVFALDPATVFFEAKAGPYRPLTIEEKAPWAPGEGDAAAPAYLARLLALFG